MDSTNLCGTCATDVNVVGEGPGNEGGSFGGELIFDGMTVTGGALPNLTYSSTPCTSTAVCGSGVFSAVGGVCRHATLETTLSDCMGVLGGRTVLDACGECVPGCEIGAFYVGECGSRVWYDGVSNEFSIST